MDLKDCTTEELKVELKRRTELAKAQRAEEMKAALRCRNCKHCAPHPKLNYQKICLARTWGKKYPRHYTVSPSKQACEKFERKEE